MLSLVLWFRDRFAPAFLLAAGLSLLAGGIVSLSATAGAGAIAAGASPTPSATLEPIVIEPASGLDPSSGVSPDRRTATRVAIPALRIDLPVITQPGGPGAFPACDVAMYLESLGRPGEGRASYLYAHARTGMFLPLLLASQRADRGASLIGMLVQVYTSDDRLYLYEITEVRPHQTTLEDAYAVTDEQVWLQTSEGPRGTKPKLQVIASFLSSGPAEPEAAHPTARPVACE